MLARLSVPTSVGPSTGVPSARMEDFLFPCVSDVLGSAARGDGLGLHQRVNDEQDFLGLVQDGAAGVSEHEAVDVAIAPSGVGVRDDEAARSRLAEVNARGEAGVEAGRADEVCAAVGDADVLLGMHGGESGEGDVVGFGGRRGHDAG